MRADGRIQSVTGFNNSLKVDWIPNELHYVEHLHAFIYLYLATIGLAITVYCGTAFFCVWCFFLLAVYA
ncbi:MAG: hypothetical protein ABSB40_00195 [Nitrososphaeria archaeon]